jgi:hypothetical protein
MGDEFVIEDGSTWPIAHHSAERLRFFVVTHAALPADSPKAHQELMTALADAAVAGGAVGWSAYGLAQPTVDGEFVLRLETLDHLFLG